MKKVFIYTFPIILLFVSLIAQDIPKNNQQYNPCNDEKYLKLKKKDLDSMSTREFEYFILKAKECAEHRKNAAGVQKTKQIPNETENIYLLGKHYGKYYRSNAAIGGLFCGLGGGFIGWGIGYVALINTEIEVPTKYLKTYNTTETIEFEEGYCFAANLKRKKEFHGGALPGTIGSILIIAYLVLN